MKFALSPNRVGRLAPGFGVRPQTAGCDRPLPGSLIANFPHWGRHEILRINPVQDNAARPLAVVFTALRKSHPRVVITTVRPVGHSKEPFELHLLAIEYRS